MAANVGSVWREKGLKVIRDFLMALQFLTRLPVPSRVVSSLSTYSVQNFSRTVVFFPWIGLIIGLLSFAASRFFAFWPTPLQGLLLLAFCVWVTGALHLDGLMDSADGLFSHREQSEMLRIMKDSRVGAMGVIAAVLHLMLKGMALVALLDRFDAWFVLASLTTMAWVGRGSMALSLLFWPNARRGEGLGSLFRGSAKTPLLSSLGLSAAVVALAFGLQVLWPAFLALVLGLFTSHGIAKRLHGLTGDTYGAICEVSELSFLYILLALAWHGWL